ncbi:MAG: efflux RND transporter periplasmic adaptor subunit [Proteobacteria bacterium]|nr:efflux RND transporter periplasmic adaptor subunit [Pseudomonadota bacterium]
MKNVVIGCAVAAGLALAAAGGYWYGHAGSGAATAANAPPKGAAGGSVAAPQAVSVEVARVGEMELPQTITTVGSLRSDESVTLRPEVAGRIAAIQFQEGQRVAKGALLVKLDTSINEAEVEQAKANYTLAKSKYDRAVDLAKSNFISSQARDEAENNLRVAEAAVTLAQARLDKTQIRAPFSGVIGLRSVSTGDYVKEGADMVNLEAIDPLKVDFRVPEIYLTQIRTGQVLSVVLDAFPGKEFQGRVIAVNPLIDAAGRAVVIRAQVQNADQTLRPGMFARVRLVTRDLGKSLVIPEQAIVPQGDEQYVFRVVDNRAVRTRVETGQRRDAKVEVVKGLAPTDVVVTAGQLRLRDGAQVAVANATPAATPVPAAAGGKSEGAAAPGARTAAVADAHS